MTGKNGKRWWFGVGSTAAGVVLAGVVFGGWQTVVSVREGVVLLIAIDARLTRVETWIFNQTNPSP